MANQVQLYKLGKVIEQIKYIWAW